MSKSIAGALFVGILSLQGCAINAPYPDWMLKKADAYISKVEYLPDAELQERCLFEAKVSGCTKLTTGEIYVLDAHSEEFRDCVLRHERSHVYDVYVKGKPFEMTQRHEHWVEASCFIPRQTATENTRPPSPFLAAIFAESE